jgi:nicotinate-nucleotide pyrophosphorylase (carboxylating)
MPREKIIECVQVIRSHPMGDNIFIEASGGINLMNIAPYLDTGIDGISIGALTHQINSCDIKLEFK